MIRIIRCTNCQGEKPLPFELIWRQSTEWCKHCGEDKTKYKGYNFCSDKCLKEWINKFAGHKHKWVQEFKGSSYRVCKICLLGKWDLPKKEN